MGKCITKRERRVMASFRYGTRIDDYSGKADRLRMKFGFGSKELNSCGRAPSQPANQPGVPTHVAEFSLFRRLATAPTRFPHRATDLSVVADCSGNLESANENFAIQRFQRSNLDALFEWSFYPHTYLFWEVQVHWWIDKVYSFRYPFLRIYPRLNTRWLENTIACLNRYSRRNRLDLDDLRMYLEITFFWSFSNNCRPVYCSEKKKTVLIFQSTYSEVWK